MTRAEIITSFNVLSGPTNQEGIESNRHEDLLHTALLAKSHTEALGIQTVFPSLNFTCSGVIHNLYIVARESDGQVAPSFTVWESGFIFESPQFKYKVPLVNLTRVLHNFETGISIYVHAIEREFSSGDMIGFVQPNVHWSSHVLRYQNNSGDTILYSDEDLSQNILIWSTLENPNSVFPLLAVEAGKQASKCVFTYNLWK